MEEEDILREKIKAFRASLKEEKPDLDIALLLRILDMVNDASEVHVAMNPVDSEGGWDPAAPTYAVKGLKELDDGRMALRVVDDKHGMSAGSLYEQIQKQFKRKNTAKVPVLVAYKSQVIQLTDAYSHSLVRKVWAGMPFDLVLAVRETSNS